MSNKVQSIHLYPIKGMAGVEVVAAKVLTAGLEHDRRYMIVDKTGSFVSQRTLPQLAFCRTGITDDCLHITYQGDTLRVDDTDKAASVYERVQVWDDWATVRPVSAKADSWISEVLEGDYRLVRLVDDHSRTHTVSGTQRETFVSLADGYPLLMIGTASLQQLNMKLNDPVQMDRFRPNIVLDTKEPHFEDSLQAFRLGGSVLAFVKPCVRCQVVTVDQQTGLPDQLREPLRTLATYRRVGKGVTFGVNLVVQQEGPIAVGDRLVPV